MLDLVEPRPAKASATLRFVLPSELPERIALPVFSTAVRAGFPSPADDYVEHRLDLNDLVLHKEATFYAWVSALPSASFRFAVARDTLAVQLTLPLVGRVEDFHLQVSAPCRAHQRKAGGDFGPHRHFALTRQSIALQTTTTVFRIGETTEE